MAKLNLYLFISQFVDSSKGVYQCTIVGGLNPLTKKNPIPSKVQFLSSPGGFDCGPPQLQQAATMLLPGL